jgi:REP element-mobilizing transposase RayT
MTHSGMGVPRKEGYLGAMGRASRPNLPGVPFHLTARVQWGEPLLDGLQSRIMGIIGEEAGRLAVPIVAYAIMSNHLHLLAVQGPRPLGWFMHVLLRRTAMTVLRRHDRAGHLFERRYYARPCLNPAYMRAVIAYAHLNPVRAGLAREPLADHWTSHGAFAGAAPAENGSVRLPPPFNFMVESALHLFAARPGTDLRGCRDAYARYIRWLLERDRLERADPQGCLIALPPPPECDAGDQHWTREFSPATAAVAGIRPVAPLHRAELQHIARRTLAELAPGMTLTVLRRGGATRSLVHIRRAVIVRCLAAGYRPVQIARYLNVSPSTVTLAAAISRAAPSKPDIR